MLGGRGGVRGGGANAERGATFRRVDAPQRDRFPHSVVDDGGVSDAPRVSRRSHETGKAPPDAVSSSINQ